MRLKFICCDVFNRPACAAVASSPHRVDIELLPMLAHNEPEKLRAELQERINRTDPALYDNIILGYGLCGNATAGLKTALPLVMPRVHDCCALFMGSRERFNAVFGKKLSMRWSTCGYFERCHYAKKDEHETYRTNPEYLKLLEDYGEENAEYVWETLHPPIETLEAVYIQIEGFEYGGSREAYAAGITEAGKTLLLEDGDLGWFFRLVNGPWDTDDFLVVPAGQMVAAVYDMHEVVRAVPQPAK
jgi:hypothetical protein